MQEKETRWAQRKGKQCKRTVMVAVVRGKGESQEEKAGATGEKNQEKQGTEYMW